MVRLMAVLLVALAGCGGGEEGSACVAGEADARGRVTVRDPDGLDVAVCAGDPTPDALCVRPWGGPATPLLHFGCSLVDRHIGP